MFKMNPDVSMKKIGSEVFLYDRKRAYIHSFNQTGALILEGINDQLNIESICQSVMDEFEINAAEVKEDVLQFIQTLLQQHIINGQQ